MIVGTIAAAVSGYLAIAGLLAFVRRRSYDVFVVYRVLLGVVLLALIASGAAARLTDRFLGTVETKARDSGQEKARVARRTREDFSLTPVS